MKSDEYKNRDMKDAAYDKLVLKMKEVYTNADRNCVRAKINSLRTSYRREVNKMSARDIDEEAYISHLWYFNDLDFLRDQEIQMPGISTTEESVKKRLKTCTTV